MLNFCLVLMSCYYIIHFLVKYTCPTMSWNLLPWDPRPGLWFCGRCFWILSGYGHSKVCLQPMSEIFLYLKKLCLILLVDFYDMGYSCVTCFISFQPVTTRVWSWIYYTKFCFLPVWSVIWCDVLTCFS